MAAYGIPEAEIACVVRIDPKTLRKHYRDELDTGATKATAKVAESLFKKAIGDGPQSVTAAIFWLKTRAHWKETVIQESAGEIKHTFVIRVPEEAKDVTEWQDRFGPHLTQ